MGDRGGLWAGLSPPGQGVQTEVHAEDSPGVRDPPWVSRGGSLDKQFQNDQLARSDRVSFPGDCPKQGRAPPRHTLNGPWAP